jgi:hypothetical protein
LKPLLLKMFSKLCKADIENQPFKAESENICFL